MPISKRTRFEVFKRDSFTCQYCGEKAPDVVLHVDHIEPVSRGGTDELINLLTGCRDCNLGKSNVPLSDLAVVERQREQLERIEQQREQLEMLLEWKRGLIQFEAVQIQELASFWNSLMPGYILNKRGQGILRRLVQRFGPSEVIEGMRIAAGYYGEFDQDGKVTEESWERAWQKVGGVCVIRERERTSPGSRHIYHIRAILRKRLNYVNESDVIDLLEYAVSWGVPIEELKRLAAAGGSWTRFANAVEEQVSECKNRPN